MKQLSLSLLSFIIAQVASAQFGEPLFVDTSTNSGGIRQYIHGADLNNDGTPEIIVGADNANTVRIFWNNGNLAFSEAANLPATWQHLSGLEVGDVDGNGFADLITLDKIADVLAWHPNNNGEFGPAIVIDADFDIIFGRILYAEFTGDGIKDIIIIAHTDALLYASNGDGTFDAAQSLIPVENQTEFYDGAIGDFNGDGHMDFTITSGGFGIYLNDGSGNFTYLSTTDNGISFTICSADFNNDGLSDIVMKTNQLKFFLNAPSGVFASPALFDMANENFKSLCPADLDSDGDLDLLTQTDQINKVVWYQNNGDGNFGSQQIIHSQLGIGGFNAVHATDLNGDGNFEPIWSSSNGFVAFHENLSLSRGDFSKMVFTVYPNPVNTELNLISDQEIGTIRIYNQLGQLLTFDVINETSGTINVGLLPTGYYFAKISVGNETQSHPFLKR